ncbi:MAG: FeoB-associated Cys-rich membrane protein [Velocimicrobium sp.]
MEVNIGTVLVLLGMIGVISLIIRNMIKDKKEGKSVICGGDCKRCRGQCSH